MERGDPEDRSEVDSVARDSLEGLARVYYTVITPISLHFSYPSEHVVIGVTVTSKTKLLRPMKPFVHFRP